jgi:small subunit ribosomal protein S20
MSLRRNAINSKTMNEVRTVEKKLRKSVAAKSKADAETNLVEFMSVMSKAAQKGRIKRETASRRIGRLATQVAGLK